MDRGAAGRAQDGDAAPSLTNSARPRCFANILEKALVEFASLMFAGKDEDESLVAQHFKRAMAKCRTAHAFGVEMVGLFNDQSTGSDRGQRSPSANEKQMSSAFEHLRQVVHMFFPVGQVISNRWAGSLQVPAEYAADHARTRHHQAIAKPSEPSRRSYRKPKTPWPAWLRIVASARSAKGLSGVLVMAMTDDLPRLISSRRTTSALCPD